MKTFKQHLKESEFLKRLVPAIRNIDLPVDHKKHILKGSRGMTHAEVAEKHGIGPDNRINGELGYWDTGKHVFHPKHNSSYDDKEGLNIDSTRLGDTTERMSGVAMARRGMFENKHA